MLSVTCRFRYYDFFSILLSDNDRYTTVNNFTGISLALDNGSVTVLSGDLGKQQILTDRPTGLTLWEKNRR